MRAPIAPGLVVLAAGAFVVGTAELLVLGVLDALAMDLGVSTGAAGALLTTYALGISVGGPVLTALSARLPRRRVLLGSLLAYAVLTAVVAAASTFGLAVGARVLAGAMHGLFIGLALVLAAGMVEEHRRGAAVSAVVGGLSVATAIGVPAGTIVGQAVGWRVAFCVVAVLTIAALAAAARWVPLIATHRPGWARGARAALRPRVLGLLGLGLAIMAAQFMALTYITPYLDRVVGWSGSQISGALLAFGLATAAGTAVGGRAADRGPARALFVMGGLMVAGMTIVRVSGTWSPGVLLGLVAWGAGGFGLVPPFQLRVMAEADGHDLAATLAVSALTMGSPSDPSRADWSSMHTASGAS